LLPAVDWTWLDRVRLTAAEQRRADSFGKKLGVAELACIAAAESRGGFVLTDDLKARRFANALGLTVTGTLGVLDRLTRAGALDLERAEGLLAEMITRGFRSPTRSLGHFPAR